MVNYIITDSLLIIEKKVNLKSVLAIESKGSFFFLKDDPHHTSFSLARQNQIASS